MEKQPSKLEIEALEQQLLKAEMELFEAYCEMGKFLLEATEERARAINGIVDRIIEMRQCLSGMKHEKACPHCEKRNHAESIYCCYCGNELFKGQYMEGVL